MDTLPTSRPEAIACGAPFYFTGKPCKRGHTAKREVKGNCTECRKEDTYTAAESRADYFRDYNRREDVKDRKHEWYVDNSIAVKLRADSRPTHIKRQYQDTWKQRNLDKVRADTKSRRKKHRLATPPWLTSKHKAEIRELYRIAIHMTKITGEQYVVDHIYPLRSKTSCGLHVPWNLRVITRADNLKKSNKMPDD
jgi:hypothetical protein